MKQSHERLFELWGYLVSFEGREYISEEDRLINNIMKLNEYVWENRLDKGDIDKWLNNFKGISSYDEDYERKICLQILSKFLYFNEKECQALLKEVFYIFKKQIIKNIINDATTKLDKAILKESWKNFLTKSRFSHIGRPGESGCYILYLFRQINVLPIDLMLDSWEIDFSQIKSLIFLDDFIGSGSQAKRFWNLNLKKIQSNYSEIEFYYLSMFGLNSGITAVRENSGFKVIVGQVFDENYKAFSDNSDIFMEEKTRKEAKQISFEYGKLIEPDYPLGFGDSQMLLGFHHNIPNNTLPIICSSKNNWHPIFKRAEKIYGGIKK